MLFHCGISPIVLEILSTICHFLLLFETVFPNSRSLFFLYGEFIILALPSTTPFSIPVISIIAEKYKHESRNWEWGKDRWKERKMKEKRKRGKGMRDGRGRREGMRGRGREKEEYKKFGGEGEKKDNQNFCILSLNYL